MDTERGGGSNIPIGMCRSVETRLSQHPAYRINQGYIPNGM